MNPLLKPRDIQRLYSFGTNSAYGIASPRNLNGAISRTIPGIFECILSTEANVRTDIGVHQSLITVFWINAIGVRRTRK